MTLRFRRVALKKLLSVFAEQPRAFLGTFISYHILSPKSTQFCPTLSKFVHICPSLSNLRSKAGKNKKFFAACPISFLPRSVRSERRVDNSRTIRQGSICREMLTVIAGRRFWENEWHKERTRQNHLADHRKRNFE